MLELIENSTNECNGTYGVIHIDYLIAKDNFAKNIGYLANTVLNG